jgi:hypothetical protein
MAGQNREAAGLNWKADFSNANTHLNNESPEAASALARALGSAFQMADICQQAIVNGADWQKNPQTLADWKEFLGAISHYADFVWPRHIVHLEKTSRRGLRSSFKKIMTSAVSAHAHVGAKPSSPQDRTETVLQLHALMRNLQGAQEKLAPHPGGDVTVLILPELPLCGAVGQSVDVCSGLTVY